MAKKKKGSEFNMKIEKETLLLNKEDVKYLLKDWEEQKYGMTTHRFIDLLFHERKRID